MNPKMTRTETSLEVDLSPCGMGTAAFNDALSKVREIEGRRFDYDRKLWLLPAEPAIAERAIRSIGLDVSDDIRTWIEESHMERQGELLSPLPDDLDPLHFLVPWAGERADWQPETVNELPFNGLMSHQRPAVDLMAKSKRMILADDMGLGKTGSMISAIAEAAMRAKKHWRDEPKLIACPNTVKGTWRREIRTWLGENEPLVVVDGSSLEKRREQIATGIKNTAWVIVNHEQLRIKTEQVKMRNGGTKTVVSMKEPLFEKTKWTAVVVDEAHRMKNRKAQVSKGLYRVLKVADMGILATGTPVMNSPDELWSLLHALWPKEYTSYWRFYDNYVNFYDTPFGKVITGVRNPDALRFELSGRIIRRTRQEVLDLPGKYRVHVPVDMNPKQAKLYEEAERDLWIAIKQAAAEGSEDAKLALEDPDRWINMPNGAARTVRLRQILSTPATLGGADDSGKLDAIVDKILDALPEQQVVFTEFTETVRVLSDRLRKHKVEVAEYYGEVKPGDRTKIEESFQNHEIDVIVGTIPTMFQGITLTAGAIQHWVERPWNPKIAEQGEDRCDRIGQTKRVLIYIYEGVGTVDTKRVRPKAALKESIAATILPHDPIEVQNA